MTVKVSISLTDQQHAFAKSLVESGAYSNLSAVLQQGVNIFNQKAEAEAAELRAFVEMMEERRKGPFIPEGEFWKGVREDLADRRRAYDISN